MSKINLITVNIHETDSSAIDEYMSSVWNMVATVREFNPHVVAITVSPWRNGDYQIIFDVSSETVALVKANGLGATEKAFFDHEWTDGYDFVRIVPASEVNAYVEIMRLLINYWNEHLAK